MQSNRDLLGDLINGEHIVVLSKLDEKIVIILTSTNSSVSLKGEFSNPKFLPGEVDKMKPKSMWMIWPSASTKILLLCLKRGEMNGWSIDWYTIHVYRHNSNEFFWHGENFLKKLSCYSRFHNSNLSLTPRPSLGVWVKESSLCWTNLNTIFKLT